MDKSALDYEEVMVREIEPEAWLFQHEDTGQVHFVEVTQVEWGFEKNNPRLQKICPLYRHPPEVEALQAENESLRAAAHKFICLSREAEFRAQEESDDEGAAVLQDQADTALEELEALTKGREG